MQFKLDDISGKGSGLPNRYIIHGVEGWGKTSFAAQAPKPIFIETKGETGLETLIDAGQLPEVPHFPEIMTWEALNAAILYLTVEPHEYKTVVLDTLNGCEKLCHEYICHTQFNDEWGDKGFASYQKGPEVSLPEWGLFLMALDKLRATRKMAVVCLSHTKVGTFKNPEGPDYDRYQPDMNQKTWGASHKWADVVLFGNYETTVVVAKGGDTSTKKGKAAGGQTRMMYTQRHASYDAKNRLGLAEEIEMGNSPAQGWANFIAAVKAGKVVANG